jgi:hypothetical protein
MLKRLPVAAVLAMIAVLALATSSLGAAGGSNRPWSGYSVGQTWFDPTNPMGCPAGVTTRVHQPAMATHFGSAYLVMDHCPTGDFGDFAADGTFILTAANGDAAFGTYAGTIDQYDEVIGAEWLLTVDLTVTGGTGRFEGASGTAVMKVSLIFEGYGVASWPWSASWRGSLTY